MKRQQPQSKPPSTIGNVLESINVWLFQSMLLITPLFFSFSTDELFEFNKMILVYFFTIVLFGLWITRMIVERRLLWRQHWFSWFIIAFLISQILSTIFSIHPYTSLLGYYSRFHGGLLSYLSYAFLFWIAISSLKRRDLRPMLFTALASSMIVSTYAILEHFGHSFSCQLSTGTFDVSCWVQDVKSRVFATFGQPNWLAAYTIMLAPLALWLMAAPSSKLWHRLFGLASWAGLIWSLLYTQSRSGFLGLMLALGIYSVGFVIIWFLSRRHLAKNSKATEKKPPISWTWTAGGLGLLVLAIFISGSMMLPGVLRIFDKMAPPAPIPAVSDQQTVSAPVVDRLTIGGTDSGEIRQIVWTGAIDVWKRYPWLGSGVETFGYAYYLDRPVAHNLVSEWDFLYNKAHNEFLNFLATTGVVGLTTYVLLLAAGVALFLSAAWIHYQRGQYGSALVQIALLSGSAGLAVSNFFGFSTVMVTVLQFLFWAAGILLLSSNTESSRTNNSISKEFQWWQYAALSVLGLGILISLLKLLTYYQADLAYAAAKQNLQANNLAQSLVLIDAAIKNNPAEALYWSELAEYLAQGAVSVASTSPADSKKYLEAAIEASDESMRLNPEQRNFYKTRARLFIIIGQLDPKWYDKAIESLTNGMALSPTDAKLHYNRGLLLSELGRREEAKTDFLAAVELKPNYEGPLTELIRLEADNQDYARAASWAKQSLSYNPLNTGMVDAYASYSALATASGSQKK